MAPSGCKSLVARSALIVCMMDPIYEYGFKPLKELGCMKRFEVLYMMDPMDAHGARQFRELGGKKGLEVLYLADPIDEYGVQQSQGVLWQKVLAVCACLRPPSGPRSWPW